MLRRPINQILINSLDSDSIKVIEGKIYIKELGFGFTASDVVTCHKACPQDGSIKKVRTQVVIKEGCDCPPTYGITIVCEPDLQYYETQNTLPVERYYEYVDPSGSTFTAAEAAADLVIQINQDPAACASATQTDAASAADATGAYITLEGKSDEQDFSVFNPLGTSTTVVVTPFRRVRLNKRDLMKLFPIQPGSFGSSPDLANCGSYCVYYLKIKNCCSDLSDSYDVGMDRGVQGDESEWKLYVNSDLSGYAALFEEPLSAVLSCLTPSSSPSA